MDLPTLDVGMKGPESPVAGTSRGEKRLSEPGDVTDLKRHKVDIEKLTTRQYLDNTIVPILLEGLVALAKERPEDPIDFFISYLQKHKQEHVA
jgi:hypothetical protein